MTIAPIFVVELVLKEQGMTDNEIRELKHGNSTLLLDTDKKMEGIVLACWRSYTSIAQMKLSLEEYMNI